MFAVQDVGRAGVRAAATAYVAARVPDERRLPFRPIQDVQRRRDTRVRGLVRYAAATVPHYAELFRSLGIDPREIRTAEDLERLPLLGKPEVRRAPRRFVSTSWRGRRAIPFTTSGSTGTPLTVYHDPVALLANLIHTEPEKEVVRRIVGRGRRVRQLSIVYAQSTVKKVWEFYRRATFVPPPAERLVLDIEAPLDEVIGTINRYKPDIIGSYGSYLETLFRIVAARGVELHRPKLVRYGADAMTEPGRRLIREGFGIPIYSGYDAVESFRLAFTCEHGRGFHVREDLCHVRLVNGRGEPTAPGELGEVVITNLVNRGTVLLNYRLGDVAAWSLEPCPCGRSLPLLVELQGRAEDVLLLPDDRIVHPRAVWGVFKGRPEVLRYQLVQHETDRLEIRLMTPNRAAFDATVPDVLRELGALLGPSRLEATFCAELKPSASGKFRPVVALRASGAAG